MSRFAQGCELVSEAAVAKTRAGVSLPWLRRHVATSHGHGVGEVTEIMATIVGHAFSLQVKFMIQLRRRPKPVIEVSETLDITQLNNEVRIP